MAGLGRRPGSCGVLRALEDDAALAALGAGVEGDGDDDRGAGDRQLPEGRDVDDRQGVLDDAEEERAEDGAADRADAAGDRDAADDAGGDDVELEAGGDVDVGDGVARDPEVAAEAGEGAGEDVGGGAGAADVDAGVDRGAGVAADGVEGAAEGACG